MSNQNSTHLQAFGFSIPVTPAGRRTWPPRFKRFVLEKMDAGELTLEQITSACGVSRSYVYQWRMQARGKPVTAAEWRAKAQFSEIIVSEDARRYRCEGAADRVLHVGRPGQ